MGLFGKSKKDKVDNAVLLIDKCRKKYHGIKVGNAENRLFYQKEDESTTFRLKELDDRFREQKNSQKKDIDFLLESMLTDLDNIRRHLASGNYFVGMSKLK